MQCLTDRSGSHSREKDIFVFVRIHNDGQASKWLCLDIEKIHEYCWRYRCVLDSPPLPPLLLLLGWSYAFLCVLDTLSEPFYFTWPVDDGEYCAVRCLFVIFSLVLRFVLFRSFLAKNNTRRKCKTVNTIRHILYICAHTHRICTYILSIWAIIETMDTIATTHMHSERRSEAERVARVWVKQTGKYGDEAKSTKEKSSAKKRKDEWRKRKMRIRRSRRCRRNRSKWKHTWVS